MNGTDVDLSHIEYEIKELLSQRFGEIEIVSVDISDDFRTFEDEDDGVEITVVFRGTTDQLVRGRPPGLFEIVRGKLGGIGKGAFPVFNFISSDAAHAT